MPISQDTIDKLRAANGVDTTPGSPPTDTESGEIPYGMTFIGSLQTLQRVAKDMDDYGITFDQLPDERQDEFDRAHEAFQYHVGDLLNEMTANVVGNDGEIELPNGKTVDLPRAASQASGNADIPESPGNSQ